jgi:hypothetical protein
MEIESPGGESKKRFLSALRAERPFARPSAGASVSGTSVHNAPTTNN